MEYRKIIAYLVYFTFTYTLTKFQEGSFGVLALIGMLPRLIAFMLAAIILFPYVFYKIKEWLENGGTTKYNSMWIIFILYVTVTSLMVTSNFVGTTKQIIQLIITVGFGCWLAEKLSFNEMIEIIVNCQVVIILIQFIFIIMFPSQSFSYHYTDLVLNGSFNHKNALGAQMAFGCITSIIDFFDNKENRRRFISLGTFILSFVLLLMTGSATSLSTVVIPILVLTIYLSTRIKINFALVIILSTIFIMFSLTSLEIVKYILVNVLNRDVTLTGRDKIWAAVLYVVSLKPLFGYGYHSFWDYNRRLAIRAYDMGAHNGTLEFLLNLGYIGTTYFYIMIVNLGSTITKYIHNNSFMKFSMMFISSLFTYMFAERSLYPMHFHLLILSFVVASIPYSILSLYHEGNEP